jgi:hypothetical protein
MSSSSPAAIMLGKVAYLVNLSVIFQIRFERSGAIYDLKAGHYSDLAEPHNIALFY